MTIGTPKGILRRRTTPSEGQPRWDVDVKVAHESWGHCGLLTVNLGGQYIQQPLCSDQMLALAAELIQTARALDPPEQIEEPAEAA